MNRFLYVTADHVGARTGGGRVTYEEARALDGLGGCDVVARQSFPPETVEPWGWDEVTAEKLLRPDRTYALAHFYAGTFGKTVAALSRRGCRVAYTVAAHDRLVSRREHEALGIPFGYTHLVSPPLWRRYVEGYRLADVIVCPSSVSAATVRAYGPEFVLKDVRVIPHGCDLPADVKPLPERFTAGYMGSFGPDKGVRYLLEAWRKLDYKDATLVLAGRDSASPWAEYLVNTYGGGDVRRVGWVENVSDFYDALSLYVQPSATEGFGMEVLEAYAHGRPVLCSTGAGAWGVVIPHWDFPPCDADKLAAKIDTVRKHYDRGQLTSVGQTGRGVAESLTWSKVRLKYQELWRGML